MSRGVEVKGKLIEYNCEAISCNSQEIGEHHLMGVLNALAHGEFTRVTHIHLVRSAFVVGIVAITRVKLPTGYQSVRRFSRARCPSSEDLQHIDTH
jgi:hypothetical protein